MPVILSKEGVIVIEFANNLKIFMQIGYKSIAF